MPMLTTAALVACAPPCAMLRVCDSNCLLCRLAYLVQRQGAYAAHIPFVSIQLQVLCNPHLTGILLCRCCCLQARRVNLKESPDMQVMVSETGVYWGDLNQRWSETMRFRQFLQATDSSTLERLYLAQASHHA